MASIDVTAPRDGSFAWVFGRVTQDDRNVSVSFPKLVDSIPLNAVNSVCSGFRRSVVCGSDGEVYHWGQVFPTSGDADRDRGNFISSRKFQRVQLPDIVPIKLVDSNRHALYAVGNNGCLYSWTGVCEVDQKQMGVGDLGSIFLERAAQAAAVKSLNSANSSSEPSQSASEEPANVASMVLNQNDTPFKFATFKPEIVPNFGGHRVVRIACGSNYILASTSEGRLFSWGRGAHGRLGHGGCDDETEPRHVQSIDSESITHVAAGYYHSAAISATGKVFVWGCGRAGQLGLNDFSDVLVPTQLPFPPLPPSSASNVVRRSSFGISRAAIMLSSQSPASPIPPPVPSADLPPLSLEPTNSESANSNINLLPRSNHHKSSLGSSPVLSGASIVLPADISLGYQHSLLLDSLGQVWSWGNNDDGSLGFGDNLTRTTPTLLLPFSEVSSDIIVSVSAGSHHSAATTQSGKLFTWGSNAFGQLGLGHLQNEPSPVLVQAFNEMSASHVVCAGDHTFVVTNRLMVCKDDYFFSAEQNSNSVGQSILPAPVPLLFSESGAATDPTAGPSASPNKASPRPNTSTRVGHAMSDPSAPKPSDDSDSFSFISYLRQKFGSDSSPPGDVEEAAEPAPTKSSPRGFFSNLFGKSSDESDRNRNARSQSATTRSGSFRPANLPAKDPAEIEKHEDSVKALYSEFRQKLERDARDRASQRQVFLAQRDKAVDEKKKNLKKLVQREEKMEQISKLWIERFIPDFETRRSSSEVMELTMTYGIPPKLRGEAWPLAIGNQLLITPELYQVFCDRSQAARQSLMSARASADTEPADVDLQVLTIGKEKTIDYIAVDLERTFPTLAFFQESGPMHDQLRILLETYCFYRPDVGYVQGMSFLAGNLLLYMEPYSAFVCFANMLNSNYFLTFLKMHADDMNERFKIFAGLFRDYVPVLFRTFEEENISYDMYLLEWCLTLFSKRLPLDVVSRVWDCYLMFGESVIYRFAVAILKVLAPRLEGQPFDVIMDGLKTLPPTISEDVLLATVASIKFPDEKLREIAALGRIRKPSKK